MALTLIYRIFATFVSWMVLRARPDRAKQIEILVLRHQLAVLQRGTPRPRMRWIDRAVIAALTPAHLGEHAPPGRLARPRAAEAVLARACLILTDWETAYRTGQLPARTAHPHTDPATTLDTLLAAVPQPRDPPPQHHGPDRLPELVPPPRRRAERRT